MSADLKYKYTKKMDYKQIINIVILGGSNSGKTSFLKEELTEAYIPTIGVDFKIKYQDFMGENYKLTIWDTAGDARFRTIVESYLRNCRLIVFMYDASRRNSFFDCEELLDDLLKRKRIDYSSVGLLIAAKCDLPREVTAEEGRKLAKRIGLYEQISLKSDINVHEIIFDNVVKKLVGGTLETIYKKNEGIMFQETAPMEMKQNEEQLKKIETAPKVQEQKADIVVKCTMVGPEGSGKTCLMNRFADDSFTSNYLSTIGVDFKTKTVVCNGLLAKLQIWDTGGQPRFQSISKAYYKKTKIFFLVYDCQNVASFENLHLFHKDILTFAEPDQALLYLVANKSQEEEQKISAEEGRAKAEEFGMEFIEVSARDSLNVESLFLNSLDKLLKEQKV